uniref:C2H2-type domain-containing protein n=1 Tax=Photinus pyralis TaxID=7054 RepID=A0A1Y1NG24_PHOPY
MKEHVLKHNNSNTFKCDTCNYATNKEHSLKQHFLKHNHFKCDICDYTTNTKKNLKVHLQKHNVSYGLKCDVCDYTTTIKRTFEAHLLTQGFERFQMRYL